MRARYHLVVLVLLLSGAMAGSVVAKKPKPTPCPPDRYLLPAALGALTGDSGSVIPLALQTGQSTLESCALNTGAFKATAKGTAIVAKSPKGSTCGTNAYKNVVVKALLSLDCQSATVKVKAKKFPLQTVQGSRSFCGDGVTDAGANEECDGAATCTGAASCDANCKCPAASTTSTLGSVSTTTSTTSTTLVGKCLDANGHATATSCSSQEQCPTNPVTSNHFACCGDGVADFGETCDKGSDNCTPGVLCASDCTSECASIGRCTASGAPCVDATSDCPAGEGCCGNRTVDPGETCDDGNFVGGDSCPATCFIAPCTAVPASTFGAHITYTKPAGTTISGLGLFVDYPEGKVTGPKATPPFGVSIDLSDLQYGFTAQALKLGGLPTPVAGLTFQTCEGAQAAAAADFTCTVTDASDDSGNVVDPSTLSCAVTVP